MPAIVHTRTLLMIKEKEVLEDGGDVAVVAATSPNIISLCLVRCGEPLCPVAHYFMTLPPGQGTLCLLFTLNLFLLLSFERLCR